MMNKIPIQKLYKLSFILSIACGLVFLLLSTSVIEIGYWVDKVHPIPQIEGDSLPTHMKIDIMGDGIQGIMRDCPVSCICNFVCDS